MSREKAGAERKSGNDAGRCADSPLSCRQFRWTDLQSLHARWRKSQPGSSLPGQRAHLPAAQPVSGHPQNQFERHPNGNENCRRIRQKKRGKLPLFTVHSGVLVSDRQLLRSRMHFSLWNRYLGSGCKICRTTLKITHGVATLEHQLANQLVRLDEYTLGVVDEAALQGIPGPG